jgi:hypothetical protein
MATYTTPRTPGTRRPAPPDRSAPDRSAPDRSAPDRSAPPRRTSAPRHTRPITGPGTAPRPAAARRTRPRHPRAPFILLLIGLLGGALVSLLVISTTLAEGSYRITSLQQQNASLARQEQLLAEQVAQASSPGQIAKEAEELGMRPNPDLRFLNLKTGKVVTGHVSQADEAIDVPGYTP